MENTRCKCAKNHMNMHTSTSSRSCQKQNCEYCANKKVCCEDYHSKETNKNNCGCNRADYEDCNFVSVPTTAIVYIAMQEFKDLYDTCVGFSRGTIFAELDKPWLAGGCRHGK